MGNLVTIGVSHSSGRKDMELTKDMKLWNDNVDFINFPMYVECYLLLLENAIETYVVIIITCTWGVQDQWPSSSPLWTIIQIQL